MAKRIGQYTIELDRMPGIIGYGTAVGKKEGEGPIADEFDNIFEDTTMGLKSWEEAESALMTSAINSALTKAKITASDADGLFSGDLLDQSIATTFGVKDFALPHIGLFGACSTMALSLSLASLMVDSGAMNCAIAATSSHFCSAERQFRFPLEYGGKRTPTSQWTVTGSGAVVVKAGGGAPFIKRVTLGKIVDFDARRF